MAELVGERLAAFLVQHDTLPWQPGTVDCCLALADWAMWIGHEDPAAHLRGTYDTDDGFRAIISAANGAAPVVEGCVANIQGVPLDAPVTGAVGVIGSRSNIHRQWGAIFDGRRWLVRSRAGFGAVSAPALAIWEI
ncbi:DUF6950 family protein [Rhizobium ruizarguesonis]